MKKVLIRLSILTGLSIFLIGCNGDTVTMNPRGNNDLRGKTVVIVPKDTLTTPYNGNGNPIGGLTNPLAGFNGGPSLSRAVHTSMIGTTSTYYPTMSLGRKATQLLVKKYNMKAVTSISKADYKLEIDTQWYYKAIPFKYGKARIHMTNYVYLKNIKTGKTVMQTACYYDPKHYSGMPFYSYDAIKAKNSRAAKYEAEKAIHRCIYKLQTEVFR